MKLKPFFCYFGGKWRAAPHYPTPTYPMIVEPFAGAAGYATRHHHLQVKLYDVDPVIYGIWSYLIAVKPSEILALPASVENVDSISVPQEAKWLIAFWLNKGNTTPKKSASTWAKSGLRPNSFWGPVVRQRLADQVDHIRHWEIFQKSYQEAPDFEATWFIDPPYFGECGKLYKHKLEDYTELGIWCQKRRGQVMVCEREGAVWLPFEPFKTIKATPGSKGKGHSSEVIWKNFSGT